MAEPAVLDVKSKSLMEGQATIWHLVLGFIDNKLLKCVVELGIADIINAQGRGQPVSLPCITQHLPSPASPSNSTSVTLHRIFRVLVNKGVFTETRDPTTGEALYGLTTTSRSLLRDAEPCLIPMVLLNSHPAVLAALDCLSSCITEGFTTSSFKRAHGFELLDLAAADPEFNRLFNDAMASTAKATISAVLSAHKDRFLGFGTIVDVGGGTGMALSTIMMAHPHMRGINFDLPHVVASAPDYPGITHVGGDMFKSVPHADTVLMKRILHGYDDENCVKILKNCQKAISKKTGKVIIVDVVLKSSHDGSPFGDSAAYFDLLMLACAGGKERTEVEWRRLLLSAGFSRCDIIEIPDMQSIIEASIE